MHRDYRPICCVFLLALCTPHATAQDGTILEIPNASGDGLVQANNDTEILLLQEQLQSEDTEETRKAAAQLIERAELSIRTEDRQAGTQIADDIFRSSAPAETRRRAYNILSKHAPRLLKNHTQEIKLRVPNVSCYGRFQDSLREHIGRKHDWIYSVTLADTGEVRKGSSSLIIGTVAELTFVTDKEKRPQDLLAALKESQQYQLDRWTILVEKPVNELLLDK